MSDKKYTTVDGANTLITTYHLANKYGVRGGPTCLNN